MGWKAPSSPLHADLGEIPGIRELSDEERDKLAANDHDGMHSVRKSLNERKDRVAADLLNDYGQLAMDVGNFIDAWADEPSEDGPEFDLMSDTLLYDIEEQLNITKDIFDKHDVYDIVCRRELAPMMFYFGINIDIKTKKPFIVVTREDFWDEDKTIDDDNLSRFVVPEFLVNPVDSKYEIDDPDMTPSEVRRDLLKNGFIENHGVAGL